MARNSGFIGKNMQVTGVSLKGLYDMDDKFLNRIGTSGGLGYLYALSYVAYTGGTLTTYSGGNDISSTLDSYYGSTSGDALFLPAGSYTIDSGYSTNFTHNWASSVFPSGYYGVFGSGPQTTIISAVTDASVPYSDNAVVSWDDVGDIKFDGGYFTLRFRSHGATGTNYAQVMFSGYDNQGDLIYAQFKNVAFNRDNTPLSMLYDTSNDNGIIVFKNCSIGNVTNLLSNYAGNKTNKRAINSIIEPNLTTTQWGTFTDCVTNGSYFTVAADYTLTYDTSTYSTAGHLYDLTTTSYSVPS